MDRSLHTDDVVAKKGNENQLGIIERTHADVDTHEPFPEREEGERIKHDRDISQAAYRKFSKDGVPPKGTVLVRWEHDSAAQLTPEAKLQIVDRELLIGDVVRKDVRDAMSGVVINTSTRCTLQPICDVKYTDNHVIKGLLGPYPDTGIRYTATGRPPLIVDVPASELMYAETPDDQSLVIYKDWLGAVKGVMSNIALLLADGCVVEINDDLAQHADGEVDAYVVGDIALTKKGHLRTGRWIFGQYSPNTPPVGTVVQVRTVSVEVSWLQRRIGCPSVVEPPAVLERDELESEHFHLYDRTKRPSRPSNDLTDGHNIEGTDCFDERGAQLHNTALRHHSPGHGIGDKSTISNSEIDVQLSLRVRFKDLAGACVKYDGSTSHGKIPRIDRQTTRGFDINVFDIVRFYTNVTVQWQNLSITDERTIDLVPDASIDDEHAAWPGEIVHTLDMTKLPDMETVEQPAKVGVVQSVNSTERMAKIRWAPEAVIHYDLDEGTGVKSLLTGGVGSAAGEVEEVSLYDLEAPAAMNVRRGDIVLIANKTWTARGGAPGPEDRDWLGEIVDTCLDGTLVVRLGAASRVQDVNVRREDVVVAIRSDGTDADGGWEGEDGVDDEIEMLNDADQFHTDLWYDRGGPGDADGFEDYDDHFMDDEEAEEEPEATYEDENGQPMEEDEVENEDWESEDEDDAPLPDLVPQQTPPTSHSATPPEIEQPKNTTDANQPSSAALAPEPDQYAVLSDEVPLSHHYRREPSVANPTHLKRVQKEHKILQKPGAIPTGVYVRTWESRLDLLRVLFIGPADTPYQDAPFVIDFHLPPQFPSEPPRAYFHAWPSERGLGGVGRVNPNLYEDGKICLSLLGTWEGSKGEGWNASQSTLLQVLVSVLGLVLVREPYFNEAGYEPLAGLESSKRPSALYSEAAFLRARTFVITALARLQTAPGFVGFVGRDLEGLEEVVKWLYWASSGPRLIDRVVANLEEVLGRSEAGDAEPDGLTMMSKGVCIPLRRVLQRLRQLQ